MGFELSKDAVFALAIALLTWGGVWFYLFRLDRLTRRVENMLRDDELRGDHSSGAS
ncbi:MAG: hypothetical protein JWN98_1662 [Abditibacteriota bacterium]|jgi:hypothetical protein|nr:hypothetical protein [Abditibacteriota bacterium]